VRDSFSEWYGPTGDDIRILVEEATIVPDANVLLSLYRIGDADREEVLGVLRKITSRLWLPYQAGLEFQKNRLTVVHNQAQVFAQMKDKYTQASKSLDKVLNDRQATKELKAKVQELRQEWQQRVVSDVSDLEGTHRMSVTDIVRHDPVRDALDDLFAGRVGSPPSDADYAKRLKEAERRASASIPPGYLDFEKSTTEGRAGDYLIWVEILEFASTHDRDILFVTMDEKDDWFRNIEGKQIGPRTELVAEFAKFSDRRYHQLSLQRFLKLAREQFKTPVSDDTIEKVAPHVSSPSAENILSPAIQEVLRQALQPIDLPLLDLVNTIKGPVINKSLLDLALTIKGPVINKSLLDLALTTKRPVIDQSLLDLARTINESAIDSALREAIRATIDEDVIDPSPELDIGTSEDNGEAGDDSSSHPVG
jgi:hypothetical protein